MHASTANPAWTSTADASLAPGGRKAGATVCSGVQSAPAILFLVDQLRELGGGERALFDLARALRVEGFRVLVVTFQDRPDPAAYTLFDAITVLPLTSCFDRQALRVARELRRLIRRERVNIVQTYFESADLFGAVVARLSGVPCILSSRRDMGILRSAKHRLAYRALGRVYSGVLAVSHQVRQQHIRIDGLRSDRVHTIYNGVILDRFPLHPQRDELRRRFGLPAGVPLITTVANINSWKGIDVFLSAADLIQRSDPAAIFAIAGAWTDRTLAASLHEQAQQLGIADRTFFLGPVSDVPALLLASDVFALLSRSEGLPNVVLEAMAARLPVVATAVGGTPEVVSDGVTGFLVANEDAAAAAGRIGELLADPALRLTMGAAARSRVETEFSLARNVRKHVELYSRLFPIAQQRSA